MNWLALSRAWKPGGPPLMPPACALPCSWSFSAPPRPKLNVCRFQVASVKPSPYAQSCMRLCIANRFARAASMSLRSGDVNVVSGLQRSSNHWFVHGYVYSRSVLGVAVSVPSDCPTLLFQLWTAIALLPRVVKVRARWLRASTSHVGDAGLLSTSAQLVVASQHQRTRVSVLA